MNAPSARPLTIAMIGMEYAPIKKLGGVGDVMASLSSSLAAFARKLVNIEHAFPGRIRAVIDFDVPLSHRIFASADMFLNPARFEPCGLTQMYAMRYGAVPVVSDVGGLHDTVENTHEHEARGFMIYECTPQAVAGTVWAAISLWRHPDKGRWLEVVRRGMTADFSWDPSIDKYLSLLG